MSHSSAGARFTRLVVPACLSHRPAQAAVGVPPLQSLGASAGAAFQATCHLSPPQRDALGASSAIRDSPPAGAHRRLSTGTGAHPIARPGAPLSHPALRATAAPSPSVCPSVCPSGAVEPQGSLRQSLCSRARSGEGPVDHGHTAGDPQPSASPAEGSASDGVPGAVASAVPSAAAAAAVSEAEKPQEPQGAQPLDPSRPWLVHPRRTKAHPVAAQAPVVPLPVPRAGGTAPAPPDTAGLGVGTPRAGSGLLEPAPGASATTRAGATTAHGATDLEIPGRPSVHGVETQGAGSVAGEQAEGASSSSTGREGTGLVEFNGYFPHSSEFQVGPEAVLTSQEVLALLGPFMGPERRQRMHAVVENRTVAVVPVVEGLSDLGNVSAVCRTSDGLGFQNVHVISNKTGRARLFRNNRRVSMGSDKWLDVETWGTTAECLGELKRRGYRIAVTCLAPESVPIYDIDWTIPTAIVFGNEHRGVTEECVAMADLLCSVPMLGMVESFNISVATAVVLHHVTRDRTARKGRHGDLSLEQKEALLAHFALRHRGEQSQSLIEHLVHAEVEKARVGATLSSPGALKGVQRRMREILRKEASASRVPQDGDSSGDASAGAGDGEGALLGVKS